MYLHRKTGHGCLQSGYDRQQKLSLRESTPKGSNASRYIPRHKAYMRKHSKTMHNKKTNHHVWSARPPQTSKVLSHPGLSHAKSKLFLGHHVHHIKTKLFIATKATNPIKKESFKHQSALSFCGRSLPGHCLLSLRFFPSQGHHRDNGTSLFRK